MHVRMACMRGTSDDLPDREGHLSFRPILLSFWKFFSKTVDDSIALLCFPITSPSCHHDFVLVFVANFVLFCLH
jgi:hypothetical protein